MTTIEAFLVGWREYQTKQNLLNSLGIYDQAPLCEPSADEIQQMLIEAEAKRYPSDSNQMKEYPID